ncbi:hypothetical protein LTR78_006945 [Recurvomyces mirabilis]|uniref:SAGA-associated factor 11 n=1 Tax=Recurvomyces mirabilis TaxID=574656 RepID=A0AAE0WJY3_9PEZI|nr:hypothetical protein LTR78_006945 [Recurvomyces mirabilis]KAK5153329.1 hypothetical protein LTS14_007498 [Recurvomyces mirabilis]
MADIDLKEIAAQVFEDALQRIIHNTVIQQHRAHKLMLASLDPTSKLPHCKTCRLPQQLDPPLAPRVRGVTTEPSSSTQYCERRPWARRPGHDIYDNPFPKADATGRPPTKKEREAAKAKVTDGTPASEEAGGQNGTGPPSPSENGEITTKKGEKKASKIDEKGMYSTVRHPDLTQYTNFVLLKSGTYVPWHTCPSCKRSLLITRFAKHLEQCMGLSGRAASRNAMQKMSSTPGGSRAGTPAPNGSHDKNGAGDDEDEDELAVKGSGSMKKKLLKKSVNIKMKKDKERMNGTSKANGSKLAAKRPPSSNASRTSPAPSQLASADKRDRDEMLLGDEGDEDEGAIRVAKRQKLSRVGSTASLISAGGSVGMERQESQNSSFVDDASVADD